MQTEIDGYKIKMVDFPPCMDRYGDTIDDEMIVKCGKRNYAIVNISECVQCMLKL